ncbi:hypothetical protein ACIHDR_43035 [Nocardia sp. NPDC052278]|uniref:hypothetical protein n=1 Tax=unclassified Nocardia TaxID=2637762 RepID=UPI0036CF9A35
MLTRKIGTAPTDLGIPARIRAVTSGSSGDQGGRRSPRQALDDRAHNVANTGVDQQKNAR